MLGDGGGGGTVPRPLITHAPQDPLGSCILRGEGKWTVRDFSFPATSGLCETVGLLARGLEISRQEKFHYH